LARSLASFCQGGDTSGAIDDDVVDAGADDDYVVNINTTQEAWDPGPPQDCNPFFYQDFFLYF